MSLGWQGGYPVCNKTECWCMLAVMIFGLNMIFGLMIWYNNSSSHLHGTSIISCYSEIQVTAYPGCPGNWSLKCCVVVVIYVLPCCLIIVVDDGGIFKSRTRRAETRGAAEIRDTRDTTTDLPLDCVRAEQVEVRTSPPRPVTARRVNSLRSVDDYIADSKRVYSHKMQKR